MVVVFLVAFFAVVLVSQILVARFKVNPEISRKISHILSCLIAIGFYPILNLWEVTLVGILACILILILKKTKKITYLNSSTRKTFGEYFLILGIYWAFILASFLSNQIAYIFCLAVLALADTAAAFGGLINKSNKTNFGSALFFLVYVLISLVAYNSFQQVNLLLLVSLGIIVTIVERLSVFGLDNLLVPVISFISFYYSIK
jgi:dolichol kinase